MPWRAFSGPTTALNPCELDRRVAEVLAARPDVVTRQALLAAGVTRATIDHAIKRGRLHVVHPGVYARGRRELDAAGTAWAALAACGPGSAIGDHAAATRYGMLQATGEPLAVTTTSGARPHGVQVHRVRQRPPALLLDGVPTLTPHATLIELSASRSQMQLSRALAEAEVLRLVDHERLREEAKGRRRVRPLLELLEAGPRRTRSPAEDLALSVLVAAGFPRPEINVRLLDRWWVDFLWRDRRLVLEVDSWTYHDTPRHWERDQRKTTDLSLAGLTVIRTTPDQLKRQPLKLIARLAPHLLISA